MGLFLFHRIILLFLDLSAGIELIVFALLLHEVFMVAAFDDGTLFEDHDRVAVLDGGQAVRDDEDGAAFHDGVHTLLDKLFGMGVDGGGSLVENHDRRIGDRAAGDGEKLSLALG